MSFWVVTTCFGSLFVIFCLICMLILAAEYVEE